MGEESFEEFESELGMLEMFNSFLRRHRSDDNRWEKIEEIFEPEELADRINFSELKDLKFEPGASFPNIVFELEDGHKRMFLSSEDSAQEIFDEIEYRWHVYRQNNP